MKNKRNKSSIDENSNSSSETSADEVSVGFTLFNMDSPDYHSIRQFLQHTFGNNKHATKLLSISNLADLITERLSEYIGTTIKVGGNEEEAKESDPFGFISLVPLREAQGMRQFILQTCPAALRTEVERILEKPTAVIFMERMVNLPTQVAIPCYQQLLDDWQEALKEDRDLWAHDQVILFLPVYHEVPPIIDGEAISEGSVSPTKEKLNKRTKTDKTLSKMKFYYEETEIILQRNLATHSWIFENSQGCDTDSKRAFGEMGVDAKRLVVLMTRQKYEEFLRALPTYLAEEQL